MERRAGCRRERWADVGGRWGKEREGRTKERAMIVLSPAAMVIVDYVVKMGGRVL